MKKIIGIMIMMLLYMSLPPITVDASIIFNKSYQSLSGEWSFYHEELLTPEQVRLRMIRGDEGLKVTIPSSFESQVAQRNTFGTYAIMVRIPEEFVGSALAIYNRFQYSAYRLYAGDRLITSNGDVGKDSKSHRAEMSPRVAYFEATDEEMLIVLQMSSFLHLRGGFENGIYLGSMDKVTQKYNMGVASNLFVNGSIFIMGVFMLIFAYYQRQERGLFVFALFCFAIAARSLFAVPFLYTKSFLNMPWIWGTRFEYALTIISAMCYVYLVKFWYQQFCSKWAVWLGQSTLIILLVLTWTTHPEVFQKWFFNLYGIFILLGLYVIFIGIKSVRRGNYRGIWNLIGMVTIILATTNDYIVGKYYPDGITMTLWATGIYVVIQVFAMSKSYAKLASANNQLQRLATTDGLTGIMNWKRFDEVITEHFVYSKQNDMTLSILMLDLDEFKKYNDYYGHIKGDELLQSIVTLIKGILPEDVHFSRYGGEEFTIVCPNMSKVQLKELGEHIVKVVADAKILHLGREQGFVTISIGGATMDQTMSFELVSEFIDFADKQLYRSKNEGRNRMMI